MKSFLQRSIPAASLVAVALAFTLQMAEAQVSGGQSGGNRTSQRSSSGSSAYPASTKMGTATVSVDPETRRVFVVTDEETAEYVQQVVRDLDRPTPQVLIKCVFLEATYTKDSDIGIEGIYRHTVSGSSIDQFNGNAVGSTAFDLASSGGIYQFVSSAGDLEVTLAALARAGKTEILSRPSILARNNQPASINLGQQVPLITNTRFDNFGNQINTVSYEDVGINLNVTPFITDDNLVEMVVTPEISQLTDRSQWVPISGSGTNGATSVSAPVINSRSADTVVVVPDGQTVVIGGLMQNTKLDSTSKVPILGDIPLLGLLFKHKVTSDAKTELMIFMTPHIVKHPSDLSNLTAIERGKAKASKKAFSEEDLNRYLDDLPRNEENKGKE